MVARATWVIRCGRSFNGAATARSRMGGPARPRVRKQSRFNGAATARSRMAQPFGGVLPLLLCFNGAATARSRMADGDTATWRWVVMLQWGRDR